ncbi:MAG: ABC transporter permease, partial [Desulfobacteraceae bacterium]|nr:ABC transporter permease [Desulfobacteraceae bacterium]
MSFESFVAQRFLKIKSQRKLVPLITVLATLGVAVGVMVLIVVIAVMTGFQSELKRRILGIEAHIVVMRFNEWISDYQKDIKLIEKVPGVTSAAPYVNAQGMVRSPAGLSAIVLKGIDPQRSTVQVNLEGKRSLGQLLTDDSSAQQEAGIVLGRVLAEKVHAKVGEGLMIMVVGSESADARMVPKMWRLKVVGLYDTGMHQYDGVMGFMNIHRLQQMVGCGDLATGIEVKVQNVDDVETVSGEILGTLGLQYWARNWKQMHYNLFSMLRLQKLMMYVILTLIIVVAAFNIASALIIMIKEKVKDIAILRVMGASQRSIRSIFLQKGMVIGLVGIGLGACGGFFVCLILAKYPFIELPGNVYFLTSLPVK